MKSKLRENPFGFVLGVPVFIPKLYDGRNKTFFLANYEGWRIILGTSSSNVFVPTPKKLLGDFGGSGLPAYGTAACTAVITVGGCQPIDPNTGELFPGSTNPTSRFSKIANVALAAKWFPAPTAAGTTNGFSPSTSISNSTNQQTYRLDQSLGRLGNVFGRYTKAAYTTNQLGIDSIPFGLTLFTEDSSSWEISHTVSLGSRNVNNRETQQ